jgi:hypothetical protein
MAIHVNNSIRRPKADKYVVLDQNLVPDGYIKIKQKITIHKALAINSMPYAKCCRTESPIPMPIPEIISNKIRIATNFRR